MSKINTLGVEVTRPNQVLIIMRAIPGAGKSTYASKVVNEGIIHSTDTVIENIIDYSEHFRKMNESGDFTEHSRMHSRNLKNAMKSMEEGISPVIIDNTNIKANEPKAYVLHALKLGYADENIQIVDLGTNGLTAEALAARNTHGVPLDKIKAMINSYSSTGELTLTKILEAKDMYKESDVLYSAVVLDNRSKNELLSYVEESIPEGWNIIAHHMTIVFGKGLPNDLKADLGTTKELVAYELGISNMAIAVKVKGYFSTNEKPHITIAINPNGGKAVMSNDITYWLPIKPINVSGVVTEIKKDK